LGSTSPHGRREGGNHPAGFGGGESYFPGKPVGGRPLEIALDSPSKNHRRARMVSRARGCDVLRGIIGAGGAKGETGLREGGGRQVVVAGVGRTGMIRARRGEGVQRLAVVAGHGACRSEVASRGGRDCDRGRCAGEWGRCGAVTAIWGGAQAAFSFGATAVVSYPGSGCTPGLEPFHGSWTRVERPGFSWPPRHPVTLGENRRGPMGYSSQGGPLNTLLQKLPEELFSAVRWHSTGCLRPATQGNRGSPLFIGRLCP